MTGQQDSNDRPGRSKSERRSPEGDPQRLATELCPDRFGTSLSTMDSQRDPAQRNPAQRDLSQSADEPEASSFSQAGREDDAEILRYFAGVESFDAEIASLARVDALLRSSYGSLGEDVPSPAPERVQGILREVRPSEDFTLSRRTRRTVRTLLWLTVLFLSLLGAYAFMRLALRALAD